LLKADPCQLELLLHTGRTTVSSYVDTAKSKVQSVVDKVLETEQSLTNSVKTISHEDEPLFPNIMYPVVGLSAGLLITRRRGFLTRFIVPATIGLASMSYYYPKTTAKIANSSVQALKSNETTRVYVENVEKGYQEAKRAVNEVEQGVTKSIGDLVDGASAKINELTGKNDGEKKK
jgi:hypothetical protein